MTVDELMAVLEGYHCQAPVRVVVELPGQAPVALAITGTVGRQLQAIGPEVQDVIDPGAVWLLTGEPSPLSADFPAQPPTPKR